MKRILTFVFFATIIASQANAQDEPIAQMFKQYLYEINNLNESRKIKKVLKFFAEDAKILNSETNIDGTTNSSPQSLSEYAASLQGLITDGHYRPNIAVDQFTNVQQSATQGTLTALVTMDLRRDGQSIDKSTYLVNVLVSKLQGKKDWVITRLSNYRTVLQRNAGDCICYLYEKENRYATEVIYPTGFDYKKRLNVFIVSDLEKSKLINNGDEQFEWKANGKVDYLFEKEFRAVTLGKAANLQQSIVLILGEMYSGNCLNFIVK